MSEAPNYGDDDGGDLPAPLYIGVENRSGSIMLCVGDYEITLTIKTALQISAKLIESAVIAGDNQILEYFN